MTLDESYVNELFQQLTPDAIWDVTTKDAEWIIIHFNAPDSDGTHYSLWVHLTDPLWYLYNNDTGEDAYRVM